MWRKNLRQREMEEFLVLHKLPESCEHVVGVPGAFRINKKCTNEDLGSNAL